MSSRVCQARTIGHQYSTPLPLLAIESGSRALPIKTGRPRYLEAISNVLRFKGTLRTSMPWEPKQGPRKFERCQDIFSGGNFHPYIKGVVTPCFQD